MNDDEQIECHNQIHSAHLQSTITKITQGINILLNSIGTIFLFNGVYGFILFIVLKGYDDIKGENGSFLIFACFAKSILTSMLYFEASVNCKVPIRQQIYEVQQAKIQKCYKFFFLLIYSTLQYLRCTSNEFILGANTFVNILFQVAVCPFAYEIFVNESPNYVSLYIQLTLIVSLVRLLFEAICFIFMKDDVDIYFEIRGEKIQEKKVRSDAYKLAICFITFYAGLSIILMIYYTQQEKIELKVIILLSLFVNLFSLLETLFVICWIKKLQKGEKPLEVHQWSGTKLFFSLQISAHSILTILQAFQGIVEVSLFVALNIYFAGYLSELKRAPFDLPSLIYLFTLSFFIKCGMLISSEFKKELKKTCQERCWNPRNLIEISQRGEDVQPPSVQLTHDHNRLIPSRDGLITQSEINGSDVAFIEKGQRLQVEQYLHLFEQDDFNQFLKILSEPIPPAHRRCSFCGRPIKTKALVWKFKSCQKPRDQEHKFHFRCIEKWQAEFKDECINCKYGTKSERKDEPNM